jgi:hypothetical protein
VHVLFQPEKSNAVLPGERECFVDHLIALCANFMGGGKRSEVAPPLTTVNFDWNRYSVTHSAILTPFEVKLRMATLT